MVASVLPMQQQDLPWSSRGEMGHSGGAAQRRRVEEKMKANYACYKGFC